MTSSDPSAAASAAAETTASAVASTAQAAFASQRDASYVAWVRDQQRQAHRRDALLHGLQAQADPSEAAGIAGPITSWADHHAREKRLHASALAGLTSREAGQAG